MRAVVTASAGHARLPPPGPALTIEPWCGVTAVSAANAVEPPSTATSAASTPTVAVRPHRAGGTSSATVPSTPATSSTQRAHGIHACWVRITALHSAVPATTTASTTRVQSCDRRRHSTDAPTAVVSAIPGARATA